MAQILQVKNQKIPMEKVVSLLASYQLFPQFLREIITDQAIASFTCTLEEKASACEQFYEKWQLTSELQRQQWLELYEMTPEQLETIAIRELRIEKFKQANWGPKIESHFLKHKSLLNKVIYSLIRTKDEGLADELYFRLQEKEQSFTELARQFSQGPEAKSGGWCGPVELGKISPKLAQMLYGSKPGQLWRPTRLGEWLVIVRLEILIPALLDKSMRQRLLDELFEAWLEEKLVELTNGGWISLD